MKNKIILLLNDSLNLLNVIRTKSFFSINFKQFCLNLFIIILSYILFYNWYFFYFNIIWFFIYLSFSLIIFNSFFCFIIYLFFDYNYIITYIRFFKNLENKEFLIIVKLNFYFFLYYLFIILFFFFFNSFII